MQLGEKFSHIKEYLTASNAQKELGKFLSSLPSNNSGPILSIKEIEARIFTLPLEALGYQHRQGKDPFTDTSGNTWETISSDPRNMIVRVENKFGRIIVTSSFTRDLTSKENKRDYAILRDPNGNALAEFTSERHRTTITKPRR